MKPPPGGAGRDCSSRDPPGTRLRQKGKGCMDFLMNPPWWFFLVLILIGLGLVGLLLYMKNKKDDDD